MSLLSFLRQETVGETLEYLAWKYGEGTVNPDELTLNLTGKFRIERNRQALDAGMLEQYRYRHPYLESRGISESVQRLMQIGFDRNSNAITIPWFNADGTLANVKYRTVNGKMFWYAKNSLPIRNLVYGIDVIYRKQIKRAAIVEAEIDAMYLMSAGIPAVATGGSAFNEIKRDLIVKSPLEEIVIMADHDEAGQKLKRKTIEMLAPYVRVKVAGYPMRYKDANEIGEIAEVRRYINKARQVRSLVRIKT